jgi:hypothetical protein
MLQTAVISHLTLLHGTADLVMLVLIAWALQERVETAWLWALFGGIITSYVTALPLYIPLVSYLVITGIARLLQRRIWQAPVLAMFVTAVTGTFINHLLSMGALDINGVPISWLDGISLVTMPSALLNLILALPVYALVSDLANWVYPPVEEEV